MIKKSLIAFSILLLLFVCNVLVWGNTENSNWNRPTTKGYQQEKAKKHAAKTTSSTIKIKGSFFRPEYFYPAINNHEKPFNKKVKALILPHDTRLSSWIAQSFESVDRQIDTVIVIGPNHENLGPAPLATTRSSWETPKGPLKPDQKLINKLAYDAGIHPKKIF